MRRGDSDPRTGEVIADAAALATPLRGAADRIVEVVGAERYYRAMVRTDRGSWNIRDTHMADTVDRLTRHLGPDSKCVIWANNTQVGDARGTSMLTEGLVSIGQLLRERQGADDVFLIGF